jgi:hypothetical protein
MNSSGMIFWESWNLPGFSFSVLPQYIITLMMGRALSWATAVWEQQSAIRRDQEDFITEVRKVFDSPVSEREADRKLLELHEDSRSVADDAVDFRTLAAESAWNPESLFDTFLQGLSEVIKDELAARWTLIPSSPSPLGLMDVYGNAGVRGLA